MDANSPQEIVRHSTNTLELSTLRNRYAPTVPVDDAVVRLTLQTSAGVAVAGLTNVSVDLDVPGGVYRRVIPADAVLPEEWYTAVVTVTLGAVTREFRVRCMMVDG